MRHRKRRSDRDRARDDRFMNAHDLPDAPAAAWSLPADTSLRREAFHDVRRDRGAVLSEGCGNGWGGISGFDHRWRYES
jgi:hypothetical protein